MKQRTVSNFWPAKWSRRRVLVSGAALAGLGLTGCAASAPAAPAAPTAPAAGAPGATTAPAAVATPTATPKLGGVLRTSSAAGTVGRDDPHFATGPSGGLVPAMAY